MNVRVEGQVTLNSMLLAMEAVRGGHGIAYVMEGRARPLLDAGEAIRVVDAWCAPFNGYHLYYPSRRQAMPAFSLLVEALRYR